MKRFSEFTDKGSNFADDYVPFALMAVLYYIVVASFMAMAVFMEPMLSRVELYLNDLFEGLYYATIVNPWIPVGSSTSLALLISAYLVYRYKSQIRHAAKSVRRSGGSPSPAYPGPGLAARRIPAISVAKISIVNPER